MIKSKWYTKLIYTVVAVALVLSFGLVAAPATPVHAVATTYYVNHTGGDDARTAIQATSSSTPWLTIQHAIADTTVTNGDTINVAAGPYNENVNVNKSLTLQGVATVTVTAASPTVSVFTVTASNVNISGFTATGTQMSSNEGYAGIKFGAGVANCNIHDNILSSNQYGILLQDPENTTTAGNNTFTSNTASSCTVSGIEMQHSYGNTFTTNIANSNGSYGFRLDGVSHNTFTGNTANLNTKNGFSLVKGSSTGGCLYNTFTNNIANSNTEYGFREDYGDHNTLTGNTFDLNTLDAIKLKETITNLTLDSNSFTRSQIGIEIAYSTVKPDVTSWTVTHNNISGNTNYGISNIGNTGTLNAKHNWWGNASGPSTVGLGSGDKVSTYVDFTPWLCKSYATGGTDITVAMNKDYYKTGVLPVVTVNDCSKSGTVGVFAWSSTVGDVGKITIALSETGAGTGIFTGTFKLVNTTPGTGELLVNNGDTVTVRYTNGNTIDDTAIIDNTAPVVNLTTPTSGANLRGTVGISATITEANPYTAEIKIDGVQKATSTSTTPITYSWVTTTGYLDGAHTVQATATDAAGNSGTPPITVTVDNTKPVISGQVATPAVVKPAASPGSVTPIVFTAHVVDATSGVATVTINCSSLYPAGGAALPMYDDGTHGDVTAGNGTYTLNYVNNLTTEGNYTLPVNATDNAGNAATTTNIALGVWSDTVPPVITSPAITYLFALASARHGDTVTISATVTDDSGTVTGVNATCAGLVSSPVILTKGTGDTWSGTATVASTTTQIDISAWDAKNNTSHNTSLSLVVDPDITGKVINLSLGWNFISLPLIPGVPTIENPAITSVLSGVGNIAHVTRVDYYFNTGISTGWQSYVPGFGGTLNTMDDGNGYWMWMNAADTLTVKGRIMPPAPAVPPTYPVYAGWNAIGFKSLADMANGTYLAGVTSTVIWGYDATTGYFRVYPSPQTPMHGSATPGNMEVGYGYWAWVTTSGTIVPP